MPWLEHELSTAMRQLESWRGRVLLVDESIALDRHSTNPHGRHGAVLSRLSFRLEHAGWVLSGWAITLDGAAEGQPSFYQVAMDRVVAVEVGNAQVTFVEHFEGHTERRSVIRPVQEG